MAFELWGMSSLQLLVHENNCGGMILFHLKLLLLSFLFLSHEDSLLVVLIFPVLFELLTVADILRCIVSSVYGLLSLRA